MQRKTVDGRRGGEGGRGAAPRHTTLFLALVLTRRAIVHCFSLLTELHPPLRSFLPSSRLSSNDFPNVFDEPAKTRLLIQYKGPCSPSLSLSLSFLFSRFLSLFLRLFLDTNCARSFTEWRQLLGRLRKKFSERVESGRVALADSAKSVLPARSLTPLIEWTSSRAPPTLRVSVGRVRSVYECRCAIFNAVLIIVDEREEERRK